MCGCSQHTNGAATQAATTSGLSMHVEDMTCGHCASTITSAIETAFPGTRVVADPAAKRVTVEGAVDAARLGQVIALAGYTPTADRL
ncbi:heavy-metal-associated domain-containing protein [Microvirga antarctica]|uniref:heavy-metal-associated domain-containing protein n=1 Tax=Microvirga antarctica TaxID=2819233 RepID=UPI001B310827|nr:heavy-metal-associated domain-containing protein [Microvirga antarctica]